MTGVVGLVMAGGAGTRMARSHGATAKPLVPIRGVPLLERNLYALLRANVREIVVALPAGHAALRDFVEGRATRLARAAGARLAIFEETRPLGTIGAAGALGGSPRAVLVVNADNLTTLPLDRMVEQHRRDDAALTLATHEEPERSPFGHVDVEAGRIVAYREKPARPALICSAISVLGAPALDALRRGPVAGLPALVDALIARGEAVHEFRHEAPWIDVNDADAVERAEALVARHGEAFDCWAAKPDVEVVGAVLQGPGGLLLERRPRHAALGAGQWDTPGGKIEPGESPGDAIARELREELGLRFDPPPRRAVFDEVDAGAVLRHHVFALRVGGDTVTPREGQQVSWVDAAGLSRLEGVSPVVHRSLAAVGAPS